MRHPDQAYTITAAGAGANGQLGTCCDECDVPVLKVPSICRYVAYTRAKEELLLMRNLPSAKDGGYEYKELWTPLAAKPAVGCGENLSVLVS